MLILKRINIYEIILFLIFFTMTIFIMIFSKFMIMQYEVQLISQGLYSNNAISALLECDKNMNVLKLLDILDNEDKIVCYKELSVNSDIRALYLKGKNYSPPMKTGRFFIDNDFTNNSIGVVVGKYYFDSLITNGESTCIDLGERKFEVLGVMGNVNPNRLDRTIFINMNALKGNTLNGIYVIDGEKSAVDRVVEKLHEEDGISVKILDLPDSGINRLMRVEKMNVAIFLMVAIFFLLTDISITSCWLNKKRNEILVKNLTGYENKHIFVDLVTRFVKIVNLAFLSGILAMQNSNVISMFDGNEIHIKAIVSTYIILILCNISMIFMSINRILKTDVEMLLKQEC